MKNRWSLLVLSGAFWALPVWSQVKVEEPWARATVAGQKSTGVYMKLTAAQATQLVGVSSPVAGVAEVHEMKMENNVMKMSAMPAINLPAGKPVALQPGGYHVMLMDLKGPLAKDSSVSITLQFKDSKGVVSQQEVKLPVKEMTHGMGKEGAAHKH
jgi:periplasmic copper chaperone A